MRSLTEDDIRRRAYELWKAAEQNKPYVDMGALWYQAEKELLAERAAEERAANVAHHSVV